MTAPPVEAPRVVEAALRGFTCAYRGYVEEPFRLGEFVAVREGPVTVVGVVADAASGPEDSSRPLQARGESAHSAAEVLAADPHIRLLLRTTVTVVSCGHIQDGVARALLAATPPPLLARAERAEAAEIAGVAARGEFLSLLVSAPACDDAVIAAALRHAAAAHGPGARDFLVEAGKELARILRAEPSRLTGIIRGAGA